MKEYKFDPVRATEECVAWIRNWFEINGRGCRAVVGISGGKDSSIVAALCVKALGKDRVFGVLMPRGEQFDISCSHQLVNHLGIEHVVVNIKEVADAMDKTVADALGSTLTPQSLQNIPPRIRMTTLYAVSQSVNGRVANTCNLSEDWVGYSTRYGDSAGDFSPISCFTVTELKQIGRYLGLPIELVDKTPIDGLCGKTDEDNLGFTYAELDRYIREGIEPTPEKKAAIDRKHAINLFKLRYMDCFVYEEK
ncbi:MAG: NAD(+) synthase [Clostridia bacterium]|nr:NAD(+) synthase [Clostridia bacterium]